MITRKMVVFLLSQEKIQSAGRILSADLGTITLKYIRNAGGKITAVSLNKGTATNNIATNISYQPFAGVNGLTWGNNLTLTKSYDLDSQLTKQQIGTVTTNYKYDLNGNINQIADSQFGTTNYQYDKANRLTQEQGAFNTSYTYDVLGNRLTRENKAGLQEVSFYQGNMIAGLANKFAFESDAVGNLITKDNKSGAVRIENKYDASNRFSRAIKVNNGKETELARYIHNAEGERVIKVKEDGSISTFMYNDEGQLINETQYTNSKQKTKEIYWVWLETMPLAQVEIPFANNVAGTHTITYLHSDHLNTPRWATSQAKQKVWSWNSDAYGNTAANEDPLNTGKKTTIPLRFPGQYFDQETGLHYNYFRTYDPDLGRYTQPDPIGLGGGWNLFAYVDGNHILYSDPHGNAIVLPAVCLLNPAACAGAVISAATGIGYAGLWFYNHFPSIGGNDKPIELPTLIVCESDTEDCQKEWRWAYNECRRLIVEEADNWRKVGKRPPSLESCARGYVSERCGGNPVSY